LISNSENTYAGPQLFLCFLISFIYSEESPLASFHRLPDAVVRLAGGMCRVVANQYEN
jgi:hypothetical protein